MFDMNELFDSIEALSTFAMTKEKTNLDFTEFKKLKKGLDEKGISYQEKSIFDGKQVVCDNWDAVIHCGSYGHQEGLLEIMGDIVMVTYDTVEGYLTADDILARV